MEVPIQNFPGYTITDSGDVWSYRGKTPRSLAKIKDKDGYLTVGLSDADGQHMLKIHRLVAKHFIPNPYNYPQVNHKDEDKTNNHVSNLEWVSVSQNVNYGTRNNKVRQANSKPVVQVFPDGSYMRFSSAREVAKHYGISPSSVTHVCRGDWPSVGGRVFRYE